MTLLDRLRVPIEGPHMKLKDAAAYCGYSPDAFARTLRGFDLPRTGPRRNRFARSVLDAWMASPETFQRQDQQPVPGRGRPRPIIAVQV